MNNISMRARRLTICLFMLCSTRATAGGSCQQVASVVSIQGGAEILKEGETKWRPLAQNEIICKEDTLRGEKGGEVRVRDVKTREIIRILPNVQIPAEPTIDIEPPVHEVESQSENETRDSTANEPTKANNMEFLFVYIIAPLIVSAITGAFAWYWGKRQSRKRIEAAPRQFVNELDKLIQRAHEEGLNSAIVNARAIVATRNALRSSLTSISIQLNSEIDKLASDVGKATETLDTLSQVSKSGEPKEVYETIMVLVRIWPAKKQQIEVEIRKLLAELGLDIVAVSTKD